MPDNRIIYYGIVALAATVLLWIGAELTKRIEWILPYTGGVAIAMVVGGFLYEWWKLRSRRGSARTPSDWTEAPAAARR